MNSQASITVWLRDAAAGAAQQMVLWGLDVRHPGGNWLVRSGMIRRPSVGLQGTSCYSQDWEGGSIELHGALASWVPPSGGTGCLHCRNQRTLSLWESARPPVPGTDHGVSSDAPERWKAFQPLLRWIVSYEEGVLAGLGAGWRNECWKAVRNLPKSPAWLPPKRALTWWSLAASGDVRRPRDLRAA